MGKDSVPFLPRQHDEDIVVHQDEFDDSELKRIIRALNLKVTTQRMAILKSLHEGRRHVTAQELYEKLNKDHPDIGFATVYRFLRTLTEGAFVTEVRMGGLPARYELTPKGHHDHLTCVKCGKICEFENKAIESLQEKVANQFGFKLTHHILELYGVCPACQAKSAT
ncbi:Fur family transcriptional regulator [Bdellovibrio sp. 22V]|uniref:Fur family transcriptional regulator n=1 Tax=Bdellovibrio TaxID=958 RepID=UPI002542A6CB|nr:Fur family transcriptional regulator [Bdellovibrio sp. 22V]WII73775.1 Fur family transcriptional regulator [Bdellovibrio sp. 22V]